MEASDHEPEYGASSFRCPWCQVSAGMHWSTVKSIGNGSFGYRFATCQVTDCLKTSLWIGVLERPSPSAGGMSTPGWLEQPIAMVWPPGRPGPTATADMPSDVRSDYEEARRVAPHSPRAAAALLRLALQRLMPHLLQDDDQAGRNLDRDIAKLVAAGLPARVTQAADSLRITGNDAVHPGEIDVDELDTVLALFRLINYIVEQAITQPAELDSIYEALPEGKRKGVEKRNRRATSEDD